MNNITAKSFFSYKDISPSERLSDYIECYWEFQIDTDVKRCFNIVPDGFFDFIITTRDNQIISSYLTGIWDKKIEASYLLPCKHLGIRFKPAAVKSFIKQSIGNYINSSITFSAKDFKLNNDVLLNPDNTLELITPYLNSQFERLLLNEKTDERQVNLYRYIDCINGNTTVDELSYEFGVTTRQIHRIISNDLGISPKTYIQIVRVKKLLDQINSNNLFPENSFFDQSHLIKNVKRYTGVSPKYFAAFKNIQFLQF